MTMILLIFHFTTIVLVSSTMTMTMKTKRKNNAHSAAATFSRTTRPGVQDAIRLVALEPISNFRHSWEVASSHYDAMVLAKGGSRLAELDRRREDLATDWRTATSMTKDQLLTIIIEWKFFKGKPRHALKPLLHSNSEASVIAASILAFAAANAIPKKDKENCNNNIQYRENDEDTKRQIISAINHLCELKGVGPATASAILCLIRPDVFAFMDDEVIESLLPNKKRGYTLGIYMEVNDRCREMADQLNMDMTRRKKRRKTNVDEEESNESFSEEWTSCKVGKAIWACAIMSATNDENGLSAIFNNK
jgi:hypothetical protein